jgi:uncharacterized protein
VTVPRTAAEWIRALGLVPHPEGGHYRETYRAAETVPGRGGAGPRAASTAIYFLLQAHELSALQPQAAIAAGSWFGARVAAGIGFSLVSCTVAPGFDFADFELGTRAALRAQYGRYAATIDALTRG